MTQILYFIEHSVNNLFPLYEYSEGEIRYLMDKFKEEAEDFNIQISDDELKKYIQRFDQLKNSQNIKDLRKWSLKQLIKLIRSKDTTDKVKPQEDQTPDVVYNENGLIIYNGSKHNNCILYGRGEKWCITRQTPNFANFRYGEYEITFYLVKDTSKPEENKDSFFVIHVLNDGRYRWTDRSNNPGQSEEMDWNDIERRFPVLRGLKGVFKYIPLSSAEKESRQWDKALPFRDWIVNLDIDEKQKYLIYRARKITSHSGSLFSDINNINFFKKVHNFDKIAKWMVESPDVFNIIMNDLIKAYDTFKPNYQKSLINNLRNKIDINLDSEEYSWDLKRDLVKFDKLKTKDENEFYYLFDENTIVKLVVKDNTIKTSLYLEDVDYPNVKINNRTAKYIANFPKLELLPIDVLISIIQKNDLDPNLFKLDFEDSRKVKIDGNDVLFNFKNLVAIDASTKKPIPFSNEKVRNEFVREAATNEELNKSVMKLLVQPGRFFEGKGIRYEDLIPIVKNMRVKSGTYVNERGNNKQIVAYANNSSINLFPLNLIDFKFMVPILYNESNPNGIKEKNLSPESARAFVDYMNQNNKQFDTQTIVSIFDGWESIGKPYQSKIDFINANPPRTPGCQYTPQVIKDRIFLINTQNPDDSKRISFKTGNILKAKGARPQAGGTIRPGAGRPAGRPNPQPAAVVQPVQNVPAAGRETVGTILRTEDLYASSRNPTLQRLFNSPAETVQSDRGSVKRSQMLANRGRITRILRVGPSAIYIITFNNGHKIASVSIQPNALHFIIFEDRIEQIERVSNLEAALRGQNLEEQKYIIKEFLLKKYEKINAK